ncbi:MAG: ATP-binding protein [Flavobacteriales bacterium]
MSYAELLEAKRAREIHDHILRGGYPEIWQQNIDPTRWLGSYIQTYVQRDVRLIRNITDLASFNRLVQSLAPIAGQLLNRDELARKIGVDTKTIQAWLGLLEASHIIFMLQPWHNNLNKRIVKSPKLFFHDTGLLCYLLQIKSKTTLNQSPKYGSIFENWAISEIVKNRENRGMKGGMFFFRDSTGNEVDLIIEKETGPLAIEIKSSKRVSNEMLSGLKYWHKYQPGSSAVLLSQAPGGEHSGISNMAWNEVGEIF